MPKYEYRFDPTYTIDGIPKNCVEQSSENKYRKFITTNALGNKKVISTEYLQLATTSNSYTLTWGGGVGRRYQWNSNPDVGTDPTLGGMLGKIYLLAKGNNDFTITLSGNNFDPDAFNVDISKAGTYRISLDSKSGPITRMSQAINVSGDNITVDISGFKFTDISGTSLFDITNSTIRLSDISIGSRLDPSTQCKYHTGGSCWITRPGKHYSIKISNCSGIIQNVHLIGAIQPLLSITVDSKSGISLVVLES